MKIFLLTIFGIYLQLTVSAQAESIAIAVDDDWFPYSYEKDGIAVGVQVDIVRAALENTTYSPIFYPCPWSRCIVQTKIGEREALLTASYLEERAEYAYFPSDAAVTTKSKWRVNQVGYVLVTREGEPYEFDGDFHKVPQPIGVEVEGSVTVFLEKKELELHKNNSNVALSRMLMAKRVNSIVLTPLAIDDINTNGEFAGKFKIHQMPIRSRSYFLVFSKNGRLSTTDREKIWREIVKIRDDTDLIRKFFRTHKRQ